MGAPKSPDCKSPPASGTLGRNKKSLTPSSFPGVALPPKAGVSQSSHQISECHHRLREQLRDGPEGNSTSSPRCQLLPGDRLALSPRAAPPAPRFSSLGLLSCSLVPRWPVFISVSSVLPLSLCASFCPPQLLSSFS